MRRNQKRYPCVLFLYKVPSISTADKALQRLDQDRAACASVAPQERTNSPVVQNSILTRPSNRLNHRFLFDARRMSSFIG